MDKKRIGIYYRSSDLWIAGKYYLDSIIEVLKANPSVEIVYLDPTDIFKRSFLLKVVGKLFGRDSDLYRARFDKEINKWNLDVIFPYVDGSYAAKKCIAWIPDFQENYYPSFFSVDEICDRLQNQARIAYSKNTLVLSSESAKADFERLFPNYTCDVFVLPFVSSLCKLTFSLPSNVLEKYSIKEPFFICSNQLWKHKNQVVVVNAIRELRKQGVKVLCLFTGKASDYRNPDYPAYLTGLVEKYKLEDEIRFLGFIPREDQVALMQQSIAVVQPSLFEGWNTTIEDAKLFNKVIVASSIPVHKEQLKTKGQFFDVTDYKSLAKILKELSHGKIKRVNFNYKKQVEEYEGNVKKIFS